MKTITKEIAHNKKVIIRLDLDVPLENNEVKDKTRLIAVLPTLNLLNDSASQVIIIGHAGRPDGKAIPELSLRPIATTLSQLLDQPIEFLDQVTPTEISSSAKLIMLENLRFDAREETNDPEFAKQLAQYGDLFVFEAFAVSHRKAASTVGITEFLPSYAGLRVTTEVAELSEILEKPLHPLLVIVGGAKIETKLPVINNMLEKADHIFVGGKLPYEIAQKNMTFPNKVIVAEMNDSGLDISPTMYPTVARLIHDAAMIVWNGPVGKFEDESAREGTHQVAHAIATSKAKTIIGGGETNEAVALFQIEDKIAFISVGGGAMLEFLSGKELPALTKVR